MNQYRFFVHCERFQVGNDPNAYFSEGCTPLIHCPILHSAKEHVQSRCFGTFKTSWRTKIKHFLED